MPAASLVGGEVLGKTLDLQGFSRAESGAQVLLAPAQPCQLLASLAKGEQPP
jgi:hypothetical protein